MPFRDLSILNSIKEKFLFFKRWLENPSQLGAVMPSSKALAQLVAQNILWEKREDNEYVIEIGAGTGSFTQALLEMGFPSHRLICIEVDKQLYEYLKKRFPRVMVIWGNACHLRTIIPPTLHGNIALVLSGIPMVTVPPMIQKEIVDGCFQILKPGGKMLQFTYSPFSSVRARSYKLKQRRLGTVFRNIPPATVWSYERL